jgi:hypothetical protein
MSLISFSIVFLVCAGLMGLMMSLKYVVRTPDEKEKKSGGAGVPEATVPVAFENTVVRETSVKETVDDEGELIAVISAAVTAMLGTSAKVTDIYPSNAAAAPRSLMYSPWKMASRIVNNDGI